MKGPADLNTVAYGPEWSARWEVDFGQRPDTEDAIRCLAELADDQPVLEFGVGTGRLALPLQDQGLYVHGLDNSPWMLDELRRKPGGQGLRVTLGNFAATRVEGVYGLVLLASDTVFAVTTQELQVKCFKNAAAHLGPGGVFVVEVMVPRGSLVEDGRCSTVGVDLDQVTLYALTADAGTKDTRMAYVYIRDGQPPKAKPFASRYAWPAELDLMARIAGMRLRYRWGGWDRRPFTAASKKHVSVYERRETEPGDEGR